MRMHTFLQITQAVFNGAYKERLPIHYLDGSPGAAINYLNEQSVYENLLPQSERRGVEKVFFTIYITELKVCFRSKFAFLNNLKKNI